MSTLYLILAYLCVSIFSVIFNKLLFTYSEYKFPFPFLTAFIQIIFSFILLCLWAYIQSTYFKNRWHLLRIPPFRWDSSTALRVAPLTLVYMCLLIFSPFFFQRVEASCYHFTNSLSIVFSLLFSAKVLLVSTSSPVATAALLIVFGTFLSTMGYLNVSIEGVFYMVSWPAVNALHAIYIKKTLISLRNNQWILIQYNTVMIAIVLIPFILLSGELDEILNSVWFWDETGFWIQMILTSLTGLMTNFIMINVIMYTSPLTFSVLSVTRTVLQTLLVAVIFGNRITFMNISGMIVSFIGACYYGHLKAKDAVLDT
ncbi:hypothetical protein BDB01DRAFT_847378 [Pilobolus umbonatus]|nr:hypothetical protein BDB01DRAFT_847378 [Pilobolus umbonatus]